MQSKIQAALPATHPSSFTVDWTMVFAELGWTLWAAQVKVSFEVTWNPAHLFLSFISGKKNSRTGGELGGYAVLRESDGVWT